MPMPRGVRLTFTYDADGIRLHSRTVVGKQPPYHGDAMMRGATAGALLAEVHTAAGEITYRRTVPHGMPATIEVFGPNGIARVPNLAASGAFTVVLPIEPPGSEVVLLGQPPGLLAADRRVELGRFPLHAEPEG